MRVQDILRTKGAKLSAILPDASIREAAPSSLQLKRPSSLLKNRSPRIVCMILFAVRQRGQFGDARGFSESGWIVFLPLA